jgi:hypothetical protein
MFPWKVLENFAPIRARTPLLHRDEGRPISASDQQQSSNDVCVTSAINHPNSGAKADIPGTLHLCIANPADLILLSRA